MPTFTLSQAALNARPQPGLYRIHGPGRVYGGRAANLRQRLQTYYRYARILGAEDIRRLFGADNAWDVVEEVLTRYYNENLSTSPRQRMAVSGREIIRWLAQPYILQTARSNFESLLQDVAEYAEEWLTSVQVIGVAERTTADRRVLPWSKRAAAGDGSRQSA